MVTSNKESLWWRDLKRVWTLEDWGSDFEDKIGWALGDGKHIRFWEDKWADNVSLMYKYPRLYSVAVNRGCILAHTGRWINSMWEWVLGWRRNLFVWEEDQVA